MPIVLKSGSLNLLEPSGPVQACNGIDLPFILIHLWLFLFICIRPLPVVMAMPLHCEHRPLSRASLAVRFDAVRTGQGTNTHDFCVSSTAFIYPVTLCVVLIFVVPCIMLYSGEISPTRCNNCVFYSQWLYS